MNNDTNFIKNLTCELAKHNLQLIFPRQLPPSTIAEDLDEESFYKLYMLNLQTLRNGTPFSENLLQSASFNDLWGASIVDAAAHAAISTADSFGYLNQLALIVSL